MTVLIDPARQQGNAEIVLLSLREATSRQHAFNAQKAKRFTKIMAVVNEAGAFLEDYVETFAPVQLVLEEISWSSVAESEDLIREVIRVVNELASSMLQNWAELNRVPAIRQAKKLALAKYKACAYAFQESAQDLEDRFFTLPQHEEMLGLMQQLGDIEVA